MTINQINQYKQIIDRVTQKFCWKYRSFVGRDDAAQIVLTAAVEVAFDESRSELEIKKFLHTRLYGAAQDAIRRERAGLRYGNALRYLCFSDLDAERNYDTEMDRESFARGVVDARRRDFLESVRDCAEFVADRIASPSQRIAYRLYFCQNLTMKQVGKKMGLGESRVSQLIADYCSAARPFLSEIKIGGEKKGGIQRSRRRIK